MEQPETQQAEPMPHVEVRNEATRYLKCNLTADELAHKSAELAARIGALEDREVEAKEAAATIDAEKSALQLLARQVRERQENRAVGVYERWNYTAGTIETVREDTREVLDARRMAYDEQHPQQALPLATGDDAEGVVDAQLAGEDEIPAGDPDGDDDQPSDEVTKARRRRGTARLHEVH